MTIVYYSNLDSFLNSDYVCVVIPSGPGGDEVLYLSDLKFYGQSVLPIFSLDKEKRIFVKVSDAKWMFDDSDFNFFYT